MEKRVANKYLEKSIMSDWEDILSDSDFVLMMEESLNIRDYEKKIRVVDGKRVNGAQMGAMRQAFETGKTKKGAVYFLMRAVHFWRMAYLTEIKHKPEEYKIGKTVPQKLHSFVMNELQVELEELHEILEGRGVVSEKEHNEMKEDLNDKIYELEKENKMLKSSVEKEKQSVEEYYKKKSDAEQRMYEKQLTFYKTEIQKIASADRQ